MNIVRSGQRPFSDSAIYTGIVLLVMMLSSCATKKLSKGTGTTKTTSPKSEQTSTGGTQTFKTFQKPENISIGVARDFIDGHGWPAASSLEIRIYDGINGRLLVNGRIGKESIVTDVNTNAIGTHKGWFYFTNFGVDLFPGTYVTVNNETYIKDVVLSKLTIDNVDLVKSVLRGSSTPNSRIYVYVADTSGWFDFRFVVTADHSGLWECDVSNKITLKAGFTVEVDTPDDDGDVTRVKLVIK